MKPLLKPTLLLLKMGCRRGAPLNRGGIDVEMFPSTFSSEQASCELNGQVGRWVRGELDWEIWPNQQTLLLSLFKFHPHFISFKQIWNSKLPQKNLPKCELMSDFPAKRKKRGRRREKIGKAAEREMALAAQKTRSSSKSRSDQVVDTHSTIYPSGSHQRDIVAS